MSSICEFNAESQGRYLDTMTESTHDSTAHHDGRENGDHQSLEFVIDNDGKARRSLVRVIDPASGRTIFQDRLDVARARARQDFIKGLMKRLNFPEEELAEKRDKLLAALEARAAEIVEEELAATDGHAGAGPISMGGGPGTSGLTYDEFDGATYRVVAGPNPPPRVLLANFTARIKREIDRIEDGKSSLKYEITAAHQDGSAATLAVSADKYARMEWPESLGAKFVVVAGRGVRDDLRCAIQILTERDGPIPREVIRTSTGWTEIDGRMVFLHGRGAIGADGAVPVQVELGGNLEHIQLPDPPTDPATIAEAVRAVFAIAELGQGDRPGSPSLAAVMLSLPWRPIIAGSFPTTIQLSGPRETFKTESAMIVSRFFRGAVHDDEHRKARLVAADWKTGSVKGICRLLADAANTVVLVDELTDRDAVTKATAVVQSLYNAGNDVKLTATREFAATFTPQAALLTCGEAELDRQSTRSRMLTVRMTRQTV